MLRHRPLRRPKYIGVYYLPESLNKLQPCPYRYNNPTKETLQVAQNRT